MSAGYRQGQGSLSVFEAESIVQNLRPLSIEDVGTDRWMDQHDKIEKLNIQAHYNALTQHDEFVVEAFAACDKVAVLIHELLVVEMWKENILPRLIPELSQLASVKVYMVMYHEATICNLLEVLMYHSRLCTSAEESLVELVDYCMRKVNSLNSGYFTSASETDENTSEGDESTLNTVTKQHKDIGFACAVAAVIVLRYITEHMHELPIAVTARAVDAHDVMMALIPLIERPPWTRRTDCGLEKYVQKTWRAVKTDERLMLTQTEGQVWLALLNLFMNTGVRTRYHFNSSRKAQIMRLRRHFTDILLDQLPPLRSLQRAVEELAVQDPPPPTETNMLVIEQVVDTRERISASTDFVQLAKRQLSTVFADDPDARRKDLARLAATYNLDQLEEVMEPPVCSNPGCGQPATKRCSKCKLEWYCSRECQLASWKQHKVLCRKLTDAQAQPLERPTPPKQLNKQSPAVTVQQDNRLIQEL